MDLFNDFIRDESLIDVPLGNRSYTWTNKQPQLTFSKLDRILVFTHQATHFLIPSLQAQGLIVSDHAPLLLQCKGKTYSSTTTSI
jgi:endonuclease/exonuclease/phosphatase family metal-dependent hydrolase